MFKNLKLGLKIGLGFLVVLLLLAIVLFMSILSLKHSENGNDQYISLVSDTNLSNQLQVDMFKISATVKNFLIDKGEEDLQEYKASLTNISDTLDQAKAQITATERATLISEIDNSINKYDQGFSNITKLINARDNINSQELIPLGDNMGKLISSIVQRVADTEAAYYASYVQEQMYVGRLFVMRFLESNSEADFNQAIENMEDILGEGIEELEENLEDEGVITLLDEFKQVHQKYIKSFNTINELIKEKNQVIENTLDIVEKQIAKNIEDVNSAIAKEQNSLGIEVKERIESSIELILLLSIAAMLIGTASAYLLTVSITKPIHQAVALSNQLSEGNLSIEVGATGKDETGLLLSSIQKTASNLRSMIATISGASNELASASEKLATVTKKTADGIVQQEAQTELVANAMNEMALTVQDVADSALSAEGAAAEADNEANSGSKVVDHTISGINLLNENVNESSDKLANVEKEVLNISNILDVIRGIAEQTNLLALNAAIEAARAGEYGRGFSVVADEVRSLASRTQESTQEIQSIIEKLQAGTKSTVDVMSRGREQAEQCVSQANDTSTALHTITKVISVINDMNKQISSAAEQQNTVALNINENVLNVKKIAQENAAASEETKQASTEIAKLATQLKDLTVKFKV
ncbi:methyl-accepting chemotaxis protein [Marinomonas sp. C2222]|uniref:Methyl-accepting chemotaxis protein n=1 Tax=Marinomonas sargassi TaxID=2984494 RepID=A0ABT2YVQ1_9GAMM|nr:methyl-accepting chemotaxis protein [Marinomonas sargassi]MCV2403975.1 methyl-accepting chemotaxis protein [Marinomonas sargassi]